jgi:hypothetical protein
VCIGFRYVPLIRRLYGFSARRRAEAGCQWRMLPHKYPN